MNNSMGDKDTPTIFHNFYHQSPPHSTVQHHLTTNTSDESNIMTEPIAANDREPFEVVRRPRGRPPGSKNKHKPPVSSSANKEPKSCMSPYVLELFDGSDVIAAVKEFCNHRKTGICVLSGSGTVCNVSIQSIQQPTAVIFRGRFNLLSISATILPPPSSLISTMLTTSNDNDLLTKFVVSLAGPDGRMFGGTVVGPLITAGTVYIVATTFNNPIYHRLPPTEEDDDHIIRINSAGYRSVSAAIDQSPAASGGGDGGQHHATPPTVAESLSMFGGQFPTDVIQAFAQRQALQQSSFF